MKNIGILTFAAADNYGGLLQCFSLNSYLKNAGYNVEIINYAPNYITDKYRTYTPFFLTYKKYKEKKLRFAFLRAGKTYVRNLYLFRNYLKRKKFCDFRKEKLVLSEKCTDYQGFVNISKKYDIIIVGSDQIWNKRITSGMYDKVFFLEGADDNILKIAYAASAGNDILQQDVDTFKKMLSSFDFISTREESLSNQIKKMGVDICYNVLDPVFLHSKSEWEEEFNIKRSLNSEKYILVYNVSSEDTTEYFRLVNEMANKTGCAIYEIGKIRRTQGKGKLFYNVGPVEFVRLINDAEYVFTTSFHATAMSIIFEKQFWTFCPNDASRVKNIFQKFELENRLICGGEKIVYEDVINYDNVNKKKESLIYKSKELLFQSLQTIN